MDYEKARSCRIISAIALAFASLGAVGIALYLERLDSSVGSSIILLGAAFVLFKPWMRILSPPHDQRQLIVFGVFAVLLAGALVLGRALDTDASVHAKRIITKSGLLWLAVFPVVVEVSRNIANRRPGDSMIPRARWTCFGVVVVAWICVYLAAFPGIYTTDAYSWYAEFNDPARSISSQWSPVYAGLFYLFVHTGRLLFDSYECGLALFTGLQMTFGLFVVYRIMRFVERELGSRALIVVGLFYAVIPVHAIMVLETAQGAVFAPVFAMMVLHATAMVLDPVEYWGDSRSAVAFIGWSALGCILRNNALYALVVFLPFTFFYRREYRTRLAACVALSIVCGLAYSGPVLDLVGVQKDSSTRETLSMPLQQMAFVYVNHPERMTDGQKDEFVAYVTEDSIRAYRQLGHTGISDDIKNHLDAKAVESDPMRFFALYFQVGLQDPGGYTKAMLLQDLGLWYPDKAYPDARIWHYYIDYQNYRWDESSSYISISRSSLFPAYDGLLGRLFGSNPLGDGNGAAEGDEVLFSHVPLLGPLCRASMWFWVILFTASYELWRRWRVGLVPLGLVLGFVLTVALAPLIMYRYCAPFVFCIPVLLVILWGSTLTCNRSAGQPT